ASPRGIRAYRRFRNDTMVTPGFYLRNLALVERYRNVAGAVVECGVWKGGMIAGMASVLGPDREYYLFDSFEGLPPAQAIDGESALRWQASTDSPWYFDNCAADIRFAEDAMRRAGARDVHLIRGLFDQTLPGFVPRSPIAILRLDGDWYASTMTCLTHLYPHVARGGLIIIDDYHTWDGCARAVHDYLSRHSTPDRISQYGDEICYIVKR
ncbi:MAG TPA: TylF/MycF/NovP-related O-methyltransferase, partial [Longimicrobium sp.]|nr:TylF/MycF/NovP-related O-methyltransferase [Longimicrobium sp.]